MQKRRSPFLESVRSVIRLKHLAYQTEKTYIGWIVRFIRFHNSRHPEQMGSQEITEFLSNLAVERNVSTSTQYQALNALVFLYRDEGFGHHRYAAEWLRWYSHNENHNSKEVS